VKLFVYFYISEDRREEQGEEAPTKARVLDWAPLRKLIRGFRVGGTAWRA